MPHPFGSIMREREREREREKKKQGVNGLINSFIIIHRSQRRWNKELEILNNCLHHISGKSDQG